MLHLAARAFAFLTLAAVALVAPLTAQSRPDFSGKWILVPEQSVPAHEENHHRELTMALEGQKLTLGQTAFKFRVSFSPGGLPTAPRATEREEFSYSLEYILDGAEHPTPSRLPEVAISAQSVSGFSMRTESSTYRAAWTGNQLVIMTRETLTMPARSGGAAMPIQRMIRRTFSKDALGLLIVETLIVADPIPGSQAQPAPAPSTAVYRNAATAAAPVPPGGAPPARAPQTFVGSWKAAEPRGGITAAKIFEQDGALSVQLWGACRPADCDLGAAKFNSLPSESGLRDRGVAVYPDTRYFTFKLEGADLVIEMYSVPAKQNAAGAPRAHYSEVRLQRVQ